MKKAALHVLDRLLIAAVAAVIVLAAQYAWRTQGTPVALGHSTPTAYPVTVETSPAITFDDSAALASFVVQANNRQYAFESAFEQDLHHHDRTFHLTHELIDGRKW